MYGTAQIELFSTLYYLSLIFASVIVSVMGSMIILTFLTRHKIDIKEEILKNRNIGLALVLGSFIWTIGRMCLETIKPLMNAWYNNITTGFGVKSTIIFVLIVLASLLVALIIGAITVYLSIKVLMVLNKDLNEWEEIKEGNVAVALVISITVLVVGNFFESIISYIVINLIHY